MDPSWPYSIEHIGSGLVDHHSNQHWHNSAHHGLGIQAIKADELEERIFQHPDVLTYYSAVELYLRMDNATLQSIYHLRENNQYGKELAKLHVSLFESPPTDLFNLIYDLRLFKTYSATETLDRFEASRRERRDQQDSHRKTGSKLRTAPKGLTYRCPSEKCHKTFQKSGHAKNHVENQHAEYLKLYPGWAPQQNLVSSSGSQSPVSDRHSQAGEVDRERSHHQRHSMESPDLNRPRRADMSTALSETSNLNSISPRSLVFSSSSGDGDGGSRRNSRLSPLLPITPLGVDTTSMPSYYPQQLSPTLKRGRSPGLLGDPSIYSGEYDGYSVPRHSLRHDHIALARRHSQKVRR